MAEQVEIINDDSKYRVAFDMARVIWMQSEKEMNLENKDAFLDLVRDCVRALNTKRARE